MNYNERLVPSVNKLADQSPPDFKSETSIKIKSEEDTEDDIPLVGAVVLQLQYDYNLYYIYDILDCPTTKSQRRLSGVHAGLVTLQLKPLLLKHDCVLFA